MENKNAHLSFGEEGSSGRKALGEERTIEGVMGVIGYIPKVDTQLFSDLERIEDADLERQITALQKQLKDLKAEAVSLHKRGQKVEKDSLIRQQVHPIEDRIKTIEAVQEVRRFQQKVKEVMQFAETDDERSGFKEVLDKEKKELENKYGITIL